mgnify:FL=1
MTSEERHAVIVAAVISVVVVTQQQLLLNFIDGWEAFFPLQVEWTIQARRIVEGRILNLLLGHGGQITVK